MENSSNDILTINQIQLLLSEKRTSLSVLRTGIAILALPLSIFSALIATSKYYIIQHVWLLLSFVSLINFFLIGLSCYFIWHSIQQMHRYDALIQRLKIEHPHLKSFVNLQ